MMHRDACTTSSDVSELRAANHTALFQVYSITNLHLICIPTINMQSWYSTIACEVRMHSDVILLLYTSYV